MIHLKVFEIRDLGVKIKKGELIGVIGPNGSGKTHVLNKICNRINNNTIYIDNKNINNYDIDFKRKNIVCVFNDNIFNTITVYDELKYYIKKIYGSDIVNRRINDFKDYFKLNMEENITNLNVEDKMYVKILSLLIIKPSLICIDDVFTYLNSNMKQRILNYIKDNKITLISVCSDMEELIIYDKILVMNKGSKEYFDSKEVILSNEKIFNDLGLSLPFIYDINNLLINYELINDRHLVLKDLVGILWK